MSHYLSTSVVKGSIQDVASNSHRELADVMLDADVVAIVDTSASMSIRDSRGNQERYQVACQELAKVQERNPGKVIVISFSSDVMLCPAGRPEYLNGGTDMAGALVFARELDTGQLNFILISDGEPDDRVGTLEEAAKFRGRIDTIYVGPENDWDHGKEFLQQLAGVRGGRAVVADRAIELAARTETLMLAAQTTVITL